MGMFDDMKDKAGDLVDEHGDQVGEGLDKAGEFADEKTGGKYGDQIDQGTGTVKIKAAFENADGMLYPNQFVNARVLVDTIKGAVLVPNEAIQRGAQGPFVYVVKTDKTVELRKVALGPAESGVTAVREGVAAGDALIVDGADKVQERSRVEPTTRGERPPARGERPPGRTGS